MSIDRRLNDLRELEARLDARHAEITVDLNSRERLKNGGGDDTSGGMTDDWKKSVDSQLGQLHRDVRALLNRGVMAVVALAAMIAGLYLYSNEKFEAIRTDIALVREQQAKTAGEAATRDAVTNGKLDVLLERKKSGT
jgi:hypothetical protein